MIYETFMGIPDVVDRAVVFATYAHKNAVRKGSGIPYILHPLETGSIAASLTENRQIIAGAILHDVVEDTEYTLEDIEKIFGTRVGKLVSSNTEKKRNGIPKKETWRLRKEETVNYLVHEASYDEKIVIFSDKLSNLRSTYRNYMEMGDEVWKRFNMKQKEQHKWYFEEILYAVSEFSATCAYKEYENIMYKLFMLSVDKNMRGEGI